MVRKVICGEISEKMKAGKEMQLSNAVAHRMLLLILGLPC